MEIEKKNNCGSLKCCRLPYHGYMQIHVSMVKLDEINVILVKVWTVSLKINGEINFTPIFF